MDPQGFCTSERSTASRASSADRCSSATVKRSTVYPATLTPAQQRAATQTRDTVGRFEAPQAGIPFKSGTAAGEGKDFSTLFGTIGLPGLRI